MVKIRQTGNIKKNSFEIAAWQQQAFVVGIDEVGRGCLAGPVVAAAVILPLNKAHRMLKDSKIMTAEEREAAFGWIINNCGYGVGIVHHRSIDKHNIYQATLIAMKKALVHVLETSSQRPSAILIDAMPLDLVDTHFNDIPVYYFSKGEAKSSSIAAASIVAKVIRDDMMEAYDTAIPGYALVDNKGYGTAVHKGAIKMHHYSIIHRVSFLTRLANKESEVETQLEICHDGQTGLFCGSD
ncbi:MAG TPA: ribonuclease HII [Candidatus Babeliales bacterium]|jgi:ribonuclease HII|nr:ribonuclease HII [Candidatus Babeliales bacterium]